MNLDAILELDRGEETVWGAVADWAVLDGGRVAWRLWPDDADTPYVAAVFEKHGHPFVVSEDPQALHDLIAERGL